MSQVSLLNNQGDSVSQSLYLIGFTPALSLHLSQIVIGRLTLYVVLKTSLSAMENLSYALMRKDSGIDIDLPCCPLSDDLTAFNCSINESSLEPIHPDSKPLVAVIGVGYVGHHLVQVFSREYAVVGFDVSEKRIKDIAIDFATTSDTVRLTSSPLELAEATHYLISVPTLLLPDKTIDTSYLRNAISIISPFVRPGSTVVIESSVAVGMTRELIGPLALEKGCFAGMSPEVSTTRLVLCEDVQ